MRQTKPPHNKQFARVSLAFLIASAITLGMLILAITLVAQSYRGMEQAKVTAAAATARQLALSVDDRINAIPNRRLRRWPCCGTTHSPGVPPLSNDGNACR